jgi:threonine dehydrogenase-like Zn-dependent dehydrogenase
VTVSDLHPRRAALAVERGADRGLDPDSVTRAVPDAGYDVVFEASGSPAALSLAMSVMRPGTGRLVAVGNLPAGTTIPVDVISRTEVSVTSILRFPGGLSRALAHLASGLDVDWLVERTYPLHDIPAALAEGAADDPPLKIQILPSAGEAPT